MGDNFFSHGISPQEIYEQLTTGPGSRSLRDAQAASDDESGMESERATMVKGIAAGLEHAWQGDAGTAAHGSALPVAVAAATGGDHLHRGQDLLGRQAGSFETAKNTVEPVGELPEFDLMDMVDGDFEKAVIEHSQAEQRNIDAFEQYDGASMYNETNMPAEYTAPNHSGGDITVGGGDSSGGSIDSDDYRDESDGSGGPGGSGPGNYSAPGGGPSGAPVGGPPPGGVAPGGVPGDSSTSTSGYEPGQRPGAYPPAAAGPNQYGPAGGTPPGGGLVGPGPFGGGPGGGPGGGGGLGGRPGGGGPVGGPGRGPVPGGGPGGGLAAEEAARRGPVGGGTAAGGRGAGPMGAPMGGARGQGDDDTEHDRKYMYGPDPDALFDTDVLTAPPVIGEDDEE